MNSPLAYGLLIVGLVMVVAGILWNQLLPQEVYWSEADQTEYDEAALSAHAASVDHSHGPESEDKPDLAEAKQRLEESRSRLSWARTQRAYMGKAISVFGVVFLLAGAAVLRKNAE